MNRKTNLSIFFTAFLVLATSFNSTANSQETSNEEQKNLAVTERFYDEMINEGKLDLIDTLLSPDFVEHEASPGFEPNREGVKQFFRMFRQAFPDLKFEVEFTVAKGDKVVSYITISGTQKGEFMGTAASGNQINVKTIDIIRFKNGVAVEHWGVTDTMTIMEQIGAMPGPEEQGIK